MDGSPTRFWPDSVLYWAAWSRNSRHSWEYFRTVHHAMVNWLIEVCSVLHIIVSVSVHDIVLGWLSTDTSFFAVWESETARRGLPAPPRRSSRWNRDWTTRRGNERIGSTGGPFCSTSVPGRLWLSACLCAGYTPNDTLWVTYKETPILHQFLAEGTSLSGVRWSCA